MTDQPAAHLDELRADIERLLADLPTRVRSTALDSIATARQSAASVAHRAAATAGVAVGELRARLESVRSAVQRSDWPSLARQRVSAGAILGGAAAVGIVVYLVSRRRDSGP